MSSVDNEMSSPEDPALSDAGRQTLVDMGGIISRMMTAWNPNWGRPSVAMKNGCVVGLCVNGPAGTLADIRIKIVDFIN